MILVYIGDSESNIVVVQLPHDDMIFDPRYIRKVWGLATTGMNSVSLQPNDPHNDKDGWRWRLAWWFFCMLTCQPRILTSHQVSSTLIGASVVNTKLLKIPRKSTFIRPLTPSRTMLSLVVHVVHPWCGFQYLTPSRILKSRLSKVVVPWNPSDCLPISYPSVAFLVSKSLEIVYLPPTVTNIDDYAFFDCTSLRCFYVTEPIEYIGNRFLWECDRLLAAVDDNYNNDEMIQCLMQRNANLPFHRACSSTAVNSERLQGCFKEHRTRCGIWQSTKHGIAHSMCQSAC